MILESNSIVKHKIFLKFIDEQHQLQPAGVDITLKEVYAFKNAGKIDFDNKERKISDVEPIQYNNEWVYLKPGCYKVIFNEYVRIPSTVVGLCLPRSSLLRNGVTLETAVWDPGYEGRSEALLVVFNPHGCYLKRNAKIGQMIFIKLNKEAEKLYEGIYKGENADEHKA